MRCSFRAQKASRLPALYLTPQSGVDPIGYSWTARIVFPTPDDLAKVVDLGLPKLAFVQLHRESCPLQLHTDSSKVRKVFLAAVAEDDNINVGSREPLAVSEEKIHCSLESGRSAMEAKGHANSNNPSGVINTVLSLGLGAMGTW